MQNIVYAASNSQNSKFVFRCCIFPLFLQQKTRGGGGDSSSKESDRDKAKFIDEMIKMFSKSTEKQHDLISLIVVDYKNFTECIFKRDITKKRITRNWRCNKRNHGKSSTIHD